MKSRQRRYEKNNKFTLTELIVVIVILATLAAIIIPSAMSKRLHEHPQAQCKSILKYIGTTIATNIIDGITLPLTVENNSFIQAGQMNIDEPFITCLKTNEPYIWLTETVEYLESSDIPLAGDSVAHDKGIFYQVYKDGRVGLQSTDKK